MKPSISPKLICPNHYPERIAIAVILVTSLCLFSCSSSTIQKRDTSGLFRFLQDGKYGFIDKTGKVIIKPQLDLAHEFSEGLSCVCVGPGCSGGGKRKYGFIDTTGQYVVNPQFDSASDFSEGLAWVDVS